MDGYLLKEQTIPCRSNSAQTASSASTLTNASWVEESQGSSPTIKLKAEVPIDAPCSQTVAGRPTPVQAKPNPTPEKTSEVALSPNAVFCKASQEGFQRAFSKSAIGSP